MVDPFAEPFPFEEASAATGDFAVRLGDDQLQYQYVSLSPTAEDLFPPLSSGSSTGAVGGLDLDLGTAASMGQFQFGSGDGVTSMEFPQEVGTCKPGSAAAPLGDDLLSGG